MARFNAKTCAIFFLVACKPVSQSDSGTMGRKVTTGANWESDSGGVDFFKGKWFEIQKDVHFKEPHTNEIAYTLPIDMDYAYGREKTNFTKNCHLGPYFGKLTVQKGTVFSITNETTLFETPPSDNAFSVYTAVLFYANGKDAGKKAKLELNCYFKGIVGKDIRRLIDDNLRPYFVNRTY